MKIRRTIMLDQEVENKLEKMRAGRTKFFSAFVNSAVREKLQLDKK